MSAVDFDTLSYSHAVEYLVTKQVKELLCRSRREVQDIEHWVGKLLLKGPASKYLGFSLLLGDTAIDHMSMCMTVAMSLI